MGEEGGSVTGPFMPGAVTAVPQEVGVQLGEQARKSLERAVAEALPTRTPNHRVFAVRPCTWTVAVVSGTSVGQRLVPSSGGVSPFGGGGCEPNSRCVRERKKKQKNSQPQQ